jgi:putative protein kinase ArgK-like GTPase of G3E family
MTLTATRTMKRDLTDADALAQKVMAGEIRAVSRLITLLENRDPNGFSALRLLGAVPRRAEVIGITGYPGTGKSTDRSAHFRLPASRQKSRRPGRRYQQPAHRRRRVG